MVPHAVVERFVSKIFLQKAEDNPCCIDIHVLGLLPDGMVCHIPCENNKIKVFIDVILDPLKGLVSSMYWYITISY